MICINVSQGTGKAMPECRGNILTVPTDRRWNVNDHIQRLLNITTIVNGLKKATGRLENHLIQVLCTKMNALCL